MDYLLKEIDVFVKIIELGSFKAAARELRLTQSAMTQRLKKLEDVLDVRLIERTTRTVAPTAIGRNFLPVAKRMLAQFEQSMADVTDIIHARAGQVVVASLISVATYVLPAAVRRFGAEHPNVAVRVLDDSEQEIAAYVRRSEAEFAIDMRTTALDPELMATPLMEDRYTLICRPDHPLAARGAVRWEALTALPVVMLGPRSGTSRLVLSRLAGAQRSAMWRCEVQHLSTVIGFVEAGVGVGIVPGMAMRSIAARQLVQRPLVEPDFGRTIVLVERRGAELSPAAARLKALLIDEIDAFAKAQ